MKKFLLAAAALVMAMGASAEGYYMVGAFNDWGAFEPMTEVDGTYVYETSELQTAFKITDTDSWTGAAYGLASGNLTLGVATALTSEKGNNIEFADGVLAITDAKVVFNPADFTVTVTGTPKTGNPDLYLMGAFGWDFLPENMFAEADGIYTLTKDFSGSFEWKVATEGWAVQVFTAEEITGPVNGLTLVNAGSGNAKGDLTGKYTWTIDYNAMTLSVAAAEDGIEAIEAENAADAVYFNLQGVRVANPQNGMFIRVAGGKAVKVAL